jgi:chromatin segregation and condensation protein Rec8/ScpA/Scc1 (kleisin family)
MDLLREWADSDEHDRMIERLAPYRKRKQTSQLFRAAPAHGETEQRGQV